ncbi:MAG: hypothetical protein KJ718_03275 [Nanoarchaeota archaeon]|nr:hypothetical protein [Nanoarchaeota archaeon]MBU1051550.1 hypothetical protein [Nanoarchaeota archaeon]MBU1988423.1 hypothetical protein [Nanoarchaeota archaeon]
MKAKNKTARNDKLRLIVIFIVSVLVIATGTLFAVTTFSKGDIGGGILGVIISITILTFAIFVYRRGNRDLKEGYPLRNERSQKVMQKSMSMAFLVSLYLLLAIGFLSEDIIHFRDVSQATSAAVGGMAILFAIFWVYYNRKEI